MELSHDGKCYKLITVSSDISSICEADFKDSGTLYAGYIIDCRTAKAEDIIIKLANFCQLIKNPKVSFAWLNCTFSKFLEIKERLTKLLKENGEVSLPTRNSTIMKLSSHDPLKSGAEALRTSIDLLNFGKNLLDIQRLMDAHPGLLHGKFHLSNNLKRKRNDSGATSNDPPVGSTPYSDSRRPRKEVFKALKKMQKEVSSGPNCSSLTYCYMCKSKLTLDDLCDECCILNGKMKRVSCDLNGRYAIVTGGRIKIGFETSLRLLRDGCFVVITTRFTVDATQRFSKESDFDIWKHRLKIYRLDLQDLRSIEEFLEYVKKTIPHLDILINNAAQTIFRPFQYYQSLISNEVKQLPTLSKDSSNVMACEGQTHKELAFHGSIAPVHFTNSTSNRSALLWGTTSGEFPDGQKDEHGEQLDLRLRNSWTYNLDEVPLQELLQVLTINAVGPFILTAKLKPLLKQSPFERKFVVNVSAMEGQFSRVSKGHRHPHTNMAKAALNMMTRTSGLEYQMDGIYMTAVDTGWVTDERPFYQSKHEADAKGFKPPLDCKDGAARVYHPIVHGLDPSNSPYFAVFLKDFSPHNW